MKYIVVNNEEGWAEVCANTKAFNALVAQQKQTMPNCNPEDWTVYEAQELKQVTLKKVYKLSK